MGNEVSWNRPGLNRLKVALRPGDCVKVAALDRLGRSLTEVLELLGWLRKNASVPAFDEGRMTGDDRRAARCLAGEQIAHSLRNCSACSDSSNSS